MSTNQQPLRLIAAPLLLAWTLSGAVACHSSSPEGDGTGTDGGVVLGSPIDAPVNTWTWVDFPDSFCDDGSNTGIGINRSDTSSNVLIFLNGGGACWDYTTCIVLGTAARGPFGRSQFQTLVRAFQFGTVFDRSAVQNPFKDWSLVFVPYCTGDVHAGDNVTYGSGSAARVYRHKGRANIVAYLARLAATFPSPGTVVISGSSAGGFGAAFNYNAFRRFWTTGTLYLVDDSGPLFEGNAISAELRNAWYASWRLADAIDPICGNTCRNDFSALYQRIATSYPGDRFALLSSLQDLTIRSYFQLSASAFQTALLRMSADVLDPTPNFRYFFVSGESHTMLGAPASFTSREMHLYDWLRLEVTGDPSWASTKP